MPIAISEMPIRCWNKRGSKAQSAMEYLMTYGWAILVIAIVLGVLYYLGVFNSANLTPRAQPGSCRIFRPDGPGTNFDVGLSGTCNGELPQYVAKFDGQASYVSTSLSPSAVNTPITISGWVYAPNNPASYMGYFGWRSTDSVPGSGDFYVLQLSGTNYLELRFQNSAGTQYDYEGGNAVSVIPDSWNFLAFTYDGSQIIAYVNGKAYAPIPATGTFGAGTQSPFTIGCQDELGAIVNCANAMISNVQVYNTSLSQNSISALYAEGIGGAPIDQNNIVGWWPLNGNTHDYSGNLDNGAPANIVFTSTWASGYAQP